MIEQRLMPDEGAEHMLITTASKGSSVLRR